MMTDTRSVMPATMPDFPVSHAWDPITDLPPDWLGFARPDLDETLRLWEAEKQSLRDSTKVDRLHERLATLWAIETGIIERLYTIDRGTTETLVNLGLKAIQQFSSTGSITQQVARLIVDQRAALDFLFAYIKDERLLTASYLKELRQLLLRNQESTEAIDQFGNRFRTELVRGEWKKLPNNPLTPEGTIHEYCPPEFVQDEIDSLLTMHQRHQAAEVRPEVEAAWLHHRFTQIHPFQDGNGRVARALATLVFLKAGFLPLVIRDLEHRDSYLQALEQADSEDLRPLIGLFANIQTADLDDAITFVREMRGEGIREIATAAASATKRRVLQDEEHIAQITQLFFDITEQRMQEISHELSQAFAEAGLRLDAPVSRNTAANEFWWNQQIVSAARKYKYFADLGRSRRWVQLRLSVASVNVSHWRVVVSFHHKELRAGLMAVIVFLTTSESGVEDTRPVILGSANEFTYSSTSLRSEQAFREWLEGALRKVLEDWQSRI